MLKAAPLVSAGWLSFFSPLTPAPIANKTVARAVKDNTPFRPAISAAQRVRVQPCTRDTHVTYTRVGVGGAFYLSELKLILDGQCFNILNFVIEDIPSASWWNFKNMATDMHEYRRDRSRSPVYHGYRNRSNSRSPERNSRGDGLLPTPSTKYEHSGLRSRSRERYNGYLKDCRSTLKALQT